MTRYPITALAHKAVKQSLYPGAVTIDATVGNGHDTLFLAKSVGKAGQVYGFDIQPLALSQAEARLESCTECAAAKLFLASHEHMTEHIAPELKGKVAAIMFNLGYLPGGDKRIATTAQSTLAAFECSLSFLSEGGTLSIMAYPGHAGGTHETEQAISWAQSLDPEKFSLERVNSPSSNGPVLLLVRRL